MTCLADTIGDTVDSAYSSGSPTGTPARHAGQGTSTGTTCFKCGEVGHYANVCPKRNPNTPASGNSQSKQTQTPASNCGYNIARVNQINVEATQDGPNIIIGTFFINSVPAAILFDSGASHSFISARYVHANSLPYLALRSPMIVITPKGAYEATYMSHRIEVTILGRKFWAMPIVLEDSTIDLILGMNWLKKSNGVIHCARGTIELSSPDGDRFEITVAPPTSNTPVVYMINGKFVGDHIKIVREFPDVFPERYPECHQIGKLNLLLISYLGSLLFLKGIQNASGRIKRTKGIGKLSCSRRGTFVQVPHLGEHRFCLYRGRMGRRGYVLIIDHLMWSQLKISIPYLVLKICLIK
jgi:predicted aspartyl protease